LNQFFNTKLKRTVIVTIIIFVSLIVLIIAFLSPIAKYLVEKYDVTYLGREIKLDYCLINPFTGTLHLKNVTIYEADSDSTFISAKEINANFELTQFFHKNYEITELEFNDPKGFIIQRGSKHDLNFKDIIDRFSKKDSTAKKKDPVHFAIDKITINNGEFHYLETVVPVNYFIKNVNIESSGFHWNSDTIAAKFSFRPGIGSGDLKGDMVINTKNLDYKFSALVHQFDLSFLEQYLKDISNYGSFRANLDADIKAKGNFKNAQNVTSSGKLAINDFHFGKDPKEDLASFKRFTSIMIEMAPLKKINNFDSVMLTSPYFKFEKYDHLDNIQNMFGKKGSKVKEVNQDPEKFNLIIEIVKYVKKLIKNFLQTDFKVQHLGVENANFIYNDFSLNEKFTIATDPLTITADSVFKSNNRVKFNLRTGIQPYGKGIVTLSINPKDSSDFDMTYYFGKLPITMFNPYLTSYTSFPLDRGSVEVNGIWHVKNGRIKSDNHLLIVDPRIGARIKNKNNKWLPLRLIMFFVRERSNVIDYEIPINGNLNDPKYNLWDVISDIFLNTLVKPPTTPYRLRVKEVENELEHYLLIKWKPKQAQLYDYQKDFLKELAELLQKDDKLQLEVIPEIYYDKEKEALLFFEAKKRYFLKVHDLHPDKLSEEDSLNIDRMSNKDSSFIKYLDKIKGSKELFTVQEKCRALIGNELMTKKFEALEKERLESFKTVFGDEKFKTRIKIHKTVNKVPFNGYSYFKINYKGDLPDSFQRSYHLMEELDSQPPRDKFKNDHETVRKAD
jgi:hypothetical protein